MKLATERALQLDPEIAESYLASARMQLLCEWNFERAVRAFKKAFEFNWDTAEFHGQYALLLSIQENHAKAKEQVALALSSDPFSLINQFYAGYVYWAAGDADKAIAQGRRLVALEPAFWGGRRAAKGFYVFSYFSNKMVYSGKPLGLRMNFITHFNADKKIDRYITYYDRAPLIQIMGKNLLEKKKAE